MNNNVPQQQVGTGGHLSRYIHHNSTYNQKVGKSPSSSTVSKPYLQNSKIDAQIKNDQNERAAKVRERLQKKIQQEPTENQAITIVGTAILMNSLGDKDVNKNPTLI